jgi:hypothetical protein
MRDLTLDLAIDIDAPPERVWPLLCGARMELPPPCWFHLGVPLPRECRLPDGKGGVGARRQCVSSLGCIDQRITTWEAGRRLAFERVEDTIGLGTCLTRMEDAFTLERRPEGMTRLRRLTRFGVRGPCASAKTFVLRLVAARVHRYVLENFRALAEGGGRVSVQGGGRCPGDVMRSHFTAYRSPVSQASGPLCTTRPGPR